MMENLILVLLGAAVLLGAEAIYHVVRYRGERDRDRLRRRLRSLTEPGAPSLLRERRVARSAAVSRLLQSFPLTRRIEELLLQTDLEWTVATVLGMGLLLGMGLSSAFLFALPKVRVLALLGLPLGLLMPIFFVFNSRARRSAKISVQMPEALDMMARSLQAGHGISSGFKLVATEMPPPIAVEFGRCFEENNLGVDFRDAVTNMTYRMPDNLDLKLFAVSLVIQHETGGNLVEILEQIGATIRERFKFYGKLRSLTAEGRASAVVLGALPFFFGLGIAVINPKYAAPLLFDPAGRMILLIAFVLWIVGLLWIRALSQLDY